MLPHPLTSFETQRNYQNEPRLTGAYSRNNLPKIKGSAYVIFLHEYANIGTIGMLFMLKPDSNLSKKLSFNCLNKSPLKIMKNVFYSILKALFVLKIFKFVA